MTAGAALYHLQAVPTATPAACGSGPQKLRAVVLLGGSGDSQVEFKDAATDTGTVLFSVNAKAGTTCMVDLTDFGGIAFATGLFCKPAGTGAIAYVWFG